VFEHRAGKHIVFVTPFPISGTGGSSRWLVALDRGLRAAGHRTTIVEFGDGQQTPSHTAPNVDGPTLVRVPTGGRFAAPSRRMLAAVFRVHRRMPADLIVSFTLYPGGVIAAAASKAMRVPLLVVAHGEDVTCTDGRWLPQTLARWTLRQAVLCSSSSTFTARAVHELAPDTEVAVIRPGIDVQRFEAVDPAHVAALRDRFGLSGRGPIVLTVARLEERKGHDTVIAALPALLERFPDLVYLVIGAGDTTRLNELARSLGVDGNVVIAASIAEADLAALFHLCDVHVMVSRRDEHTGQTEGLGLVYAEAAAAGRPSVAGSDGGCADAVLDGVTGFVVDPRSPVEVGAAIADLLNDHARYDHMAAAGRDHSRAAFDTHRQSELAVAVLVASASQTSTPALSG
jgi:phosphatidyl-myo-inositol dimannoside synthase